MIDLVEHLITVPPIVTTLVVEPPPQLLINCATSILPSWKCYAVYLGFQTRVFLSWLECEQVVKDFSGAEFCGFKNSWEANRYLSG